MAGDASAYAALGLDPGADSAAIEAAYKRLIKRHHPDRDGGDAIRAAEINRAYRELRAARSLKEPLELNDEWAAAPREGRAWLATAFILLLAVAMLVVAKAPPAPLPHAMRSAASVIAPDPMDQPLHLVAIDRSVQDALHLQRTRDEMALANASRDCHHRLRNDPSLLQLDRCAAFDDAVVQLQDRDPLRDQGPFSELAVTGRILSGATALSDDSVAIDGRLDRIRLLVELALVPAVPAEPQGAKPN
jgi:hypothetical protein